jgi:hypothetical protein
MSRNNNGLTQELLRSPAWRSMGISSRRIIDFLLAEHLRLKCRRNGQLKAPWHQLRAFGITRRRISAAIVDLEDSGLVMCTKPGGRAASTYRLTWLPTHDGRPATNEWREVRAINEWKVGAAQYPNLVPTGGPGESPNLVSPGGPDFTGQSGPPWGTSYSKRKKERKKEPLGRDSPAVPLPCPPSTPCSDGNLSLDRPGSVSARAGTGRAGGDQTKVDASGKFGRTAAAEKLPWSKPTYVEIVLAKPRRVSWARP